jgi:hypothetical protein
VKTPPASSPPLAVTNPGPITASISIRRLRQPRAKNFIGSVAMPQHGDHVVGRDDAGEAAVFVDDRQRYQVVFVEQRGDLVLRRIPLARDVGLAQLRQLDSRR